MDLSVAQKLAKANFIFGLFVMFCGPLNFIPYAIAVLMLLGTVKLVLNSDLLGMSRFYAKSSERYFADRYVCRYC